MSEMLSAPESKKGRLQRACLELLREHEHDDALPTNGRFLFYELEQQGVIPKWYLNERGSKRARQPAQDLSDALMVLRRRGLVPWDWIIDETRDVSEWRYAESVYKYTVEEAQHARIDCWDGALPPLIICEARSTSGVLERLAAEYLCPIAATSGQCGGFLVNEIAPLLADNDRRVLYVGDHELRGPAEQIEANTRRYLEEHANRVFAADWEKIALTEVQVRANPRLRQKVITKIDRRYKPPREYEAVECEALKQKILLNIIRKKLDAMLPEPLDDVRIREQAQRRKLAAMLRKIARSP
jgi:hypothetical protein